MKQLIDKDALVAEIEKVIDEPAPSHDSQCPWEDGYYCGLYKAESILNTLEVKEVDLKKEIDDYINEHFSECDDGVLLSDANSTELTLLDVTSIARHFFELGLKAKGE